MRNQRASIGQVGLVLACASIGVCPAAGAQTVDKNGGASAAAVPKGAGATAQVAQQSFTNRPEDEKAIRAMADAFKRGYDAGDANALAALYAEDAEFIDEYGSALVGRAAIHDFYRAMFEERRGARIAISPESLRFLGADAAKEEGQTQVTPTGGEPASHRRYTVLFVKEGGRWVYSSVREEHAPGIAHHERLKALEWLLGEWLDQSPDSTVHVNCHWSPDKNFLMREFTIHVQGKPVMTVTQRIGWDPLLKQIRSWVFDSEGGYADGLWIRNGKEWVIKSTGVLTDGRVATATHMLTPLGPNSIRWSSIERTVGGHLIPEPAEYVMVRKPPPPQ